MTDMSVTQLTKPGESTTLTRASGQWRSRPADERYKSIIAMEERALIYQSNSHEFLMPLREAQIEVEADEIKIAGAPMTNWAFSQFASKIKAPGSYLRTLPPQLAAQNIEHGLSLVGDEQSKLLVADGRIGAFTSERYVRIWNSEILHWLRELQANQPWWTWPEAFRTASGQKAGAWGEHEVLPVGFLSDRDMFVFLADYQHPIEIPGVEHPLLRGFWVENSEAGAGAVRITLFLFDHVCCNVLVWGARNVIEVKINHIGRARERVLFDDSEVRAAISEYSNRSTEGDVRRITSARNMLVADTRGEVIDLLYKQRLPGLSKKVIESAYAIQERTPRYGDPRTVWAAVNGLTEESQKCENADERAEIDRSAGRLLEAFVPT